MKLGAFSISLNVKDLKISKDFYEKLGFKILGGEFEHNYLIMKNEDSIIGLFQGMFDKNILTFNPGWNQNAQTLDDFDDVRKLNKIIKQNGITTEGESFEKSSGPGSFIVTDPDGNQILIDQHV